MNTWPARLDERWFVVAESAALTNRPRAVVLLDRPLAIARLASGDLMAVDDRCPHRLFPLSAGRVTPAGLRCAYHGWTFDGHGRCTAMPGSSTPTDRPDVRVRTYEAVDDDGLIWVRPTPTAKGGQPPFVGSLPPDSRRLVWSARWRCNALDALENFLDPLHTQSIHAGLVRRDRARRPVDATLRPFDGGFTVDYEGQPAQSGLLYRLFESPRALERAHYLDAAAGSARIEYRYRNGSALHFTLHFTPEAAWTTKVHATLHVENRWAPAWAVRRIAGPFLRRVARQDQRAVETQATNMQRFGQTRGLSTELDLVRACLDRVWTPGRVDAPMPKRTIRLML